MPQFGGGMEQFMAAISFNYDLTIQQANELNEIGNQLLNTSVKALNEINGNVDAAWTGDNATIYKKYLVNLMDDLTQKAKYMTQASEALISAAKKIKQAEDIAKQSSQQI